MLNKFFDIDKQRQMADYFLQQLAPKGKVEIINKHQIIDPLTADTIYLVMTGSFDQEIYSAKGEKMSLFRLVPGTIFGEMDFFDEARTCVMTKARQKSKVSILERSLVEAELRLEPALYHYFLHSIIRKYRIVMLELADIKFNDAAGKLAQSLIRFAYLSQPSFNFEGLAGQLAGQVIYTNFTHEELADRILCNRSTVTNILNQFKEKGWINIIDKQIIITNLDGLKSAVNPYYQIN